MTEKTTETKKAGRPTNAEKMAKLQEQNDNLMKASVETEERYSKLEAMFEQLMAKKDEPSVPTPVATSQPESYNTTGDQIPLTEYIKVISLCPHNLNLSRHRGDNQPKTFRGFGDSKRILYQDLVSILDHHVNFRDQGLFYVVDERVIRQHGLNDLYATLLTEQTIRSMVNGKSENLEELFRSANDFQRKIITDMIVERIVAGRDVDLNMIDRLERIISGIAKSKIEASAPKGEEITPQMIESAEKKLGAKMHQRAKDIKYYAEMPAR